MNTSSASTASGRHSVWPCRLHMNNVHAVALHGTKETCFMKMSSPQRCGLVAGRLWCGGTSCPHRCPPPPRWRTQSQRGWGSSSRTCDLHAAQHAASRTFEAEMDTKKWATGMHTKGLSTPYTQRTLNVFQIRALVVSTLKPCTLTETWLNMHQVHTV